MTLKISLALALAISTLSAAEDRGLRRIERQVRHELVMLPYYGVFDRLVFAVDGGMVTREICEWIMPREGTRVSLGISMIAAGFVAINTMLFLNKQPHIPWIHGYGMYTVLFFAMMVFESYQLLKLYRNSWDDDRQPWER